MFDTLKQSVFASLGVALMTRDKIAELASDIATRANLTAQQATEFQHELAQRAEHARQELQAEIDQRIDHAFIQLGIVKSTVKRDVEQASEKGQSALDDTLEGAIDRLGLARADDLKALELRIQALERRLD